MNPVHSLEAEFDKISKYFSPRVKAIANGQHFKLAKMKGQFDRHKHDGEDEFFLVVRGEFRLAYDDGSEAVLREGDFHVVPRGTWHTPSAGEEAWVLFVEPAGTAHTGSTPSALAKSEAEQLAHLEQEV